MFLHSLLLIFRHFKRHKSSFLINLIGLSTGLACSLLIYLWVKDELNVDQFHQQDEQLFQVIEHDRNADGISTGEHTAGLLAEALANEMPQIEYAVSARAGVLSPISRRWRMNS